MDLHEKPALVIWITGLAGSGKSTIGKALYQELRKKISHIVYLDGDELRDLLGHYDYDRQGRIEVAKKRADFARFLSLQGIVVVVTTISMFDEVYTYNRTVLPFLYTVYISCQQEELIRRDQKGLYVGALRGEIENVVGMDLSFDEPLADLVIDNTCKEDLNYNIQSILQKLS